MAEGFVRHLAAEGVEVYSAGLIPTALDSRAVAVMRERGVDIRGQRAKDLQAVPQEVDVVITLCGEAEEACPSFPGPVIREHWPLPDPARAPGSSEEVLTIFRQVRDEIEQRVRTLLAAHGKATPPCRPQGKMPPHRAAKGSRPTKGNTGGRIKNPGFGVPLAVRER